MRYEMIRDRQNADNWRVESIDTEGRCYVVIFSGPDAELRAQEYWEWKRTVN